MKHISIIKVDWYNTLYLLILISIGESDIDLDDKSIKYNIVKRPNMHLEVHVVLVQCYTYSISRKII